MKKILENRYAVMIRVLMAVIEAFSEAIHKIEEEAKMRREVRK